MRCAALLAVPALALAACGHGGAAGPVPLTAPPVVASAPSPVANPAGTVVALRAARPEGVAVAGSSLAVATQDGRLLQLSAAGTVLHAVALPGSGRHVRVSGSDALVPVEGTGQLAVVDLTTQAVRTVTVGRAPHDVVPLGGDRALVGDEADGTVSVVDLAAGRTVATLPAGLQPGGLAADGSYACAVDVRGRYLYRYAVTTDGLKAAGRLAVGAGPTHVVDVGDGVVAVADALGKAVILVSLTDLRVVATIPMTSAPEGLAADPTRGRLWVTLPAEDSLAAVDLAGRDVATTYPTVQQPNSVAVDPTTGTVYVVGATQAGQLQVLTPAS